MLILKQNNQLSNTYRLRSFVRRDGRFTAAQERAFSSMWPQVGVRIDRGECDLTQLFGRHAPTYLEIGFGMGHSLLAAAIANPDKHFIGVETHLPGMGSILMGIEKAKLTNLRLCYGDVIDVLPVIPKASLAGIHIFFPDPWPKRRHHARRLIQPPFLQLIHLLLQPQAELHLATDWEDYAKHMMRVLSSEKKWLNKAGEQRFAATRSPFRPIMTKFENRAVRIGHTIFELQFIKNQL